MLDLLPFKLVPQALELLAIAHSHLFEFLDLNAQLIDDAPGNDLLARDP